MNCNSRTAASDIECGELESDKDRKRMAKKRAERERERNREGEIWCERMSSNKNVWFLRGSVQCTDMQYASRIWRKAQNLEMRSEFEVAKKINLIDADAISFKFLN